MPRSCNNGVRLGFEKSDERVGANQAFEFIQFRSVQAAFGPLLSELIVARLGPGVGPEVCQSPS